MLSFFVTVASSGIRLAIPFLLTALGETVTEKSGVRNLGLEGIILASAFSSFLVAYNTQNTTLGLAAGLLVGGLIGVFLAILMVRLGANQLFTGVMVTILCTGLSSFLYSKLFSSVIISPSWDRPILAKSVEVSIASSMFADPAGGISVVVNSARLEVPD